MFRKLTPFGWLAFLCVATPLMSRAFAQDPGERGAPDPEDVPKAVAELQDRVDKLERELADANKSRAAMARDIDDIEDETKNLTKRVEEIDRNKFAAIDREIVKTNRAVKDLENRVRRLE